MSTVSCAPSKYPSRVLVKTNILPDGISISTSDLPSEIIDVVTRLKNENFPSKVTSNSLQRIHGGNSIVKKIAAEITNKIN